MSSLLRLQTLWNLEYKKLFEDLDNFIDEWEKYLKKCRCDNPECRHYQREKRKRFGKKIDRLFYGSLLMNACSFKKVMEQSY